MKITLLDKRQIRKLHTTSIRILEKIGVHVPHPEALDLFAEAGARVDRNAEHVYIPEEVVQRCLETATKSFTIYGRDRSKRAEFGVGKRNYNSIGGEAAWVDDDMQRRYCSLEDVRTAARLCDGLKWINLVGSMADPHEIPPEYACVYTVAEMLKNTTKPIHFWFNTRASARYLLELFTIVAGSEKEAIERPFCYPFLEPISPLRFPFRGIDLLFETRRQNLPVSIGPMAQVGATAPGTLAGTVAQENAEILAGICIVQLIQPGAAVCYGGIPHAFDMRTTQMIFCGPEQALMAVALTEIAKSYGLPVYINVGLTDSKIADGQAGLEVGITLACGMMAGADIFGHFGICGVDQATSLTILLLQHEIIDYLERLMRGMEITDEKLGVKAIPEGIKAGSFLGLEHTSKHFRSELWFPKLLDRQFFDGWVASGKKDMLARCKAEKDRILREHTPVPMDKDMEREVDKLLESAKRDLGG